MARPDPETFDRIKRTEAYAEKVRKMFAQTVNDILALNKSLPTLEPGVMFSFDDEGNRKKAEQTEMLLRRLHAAVTTAIEKGIKLEWDAANAETDKLIGSLFGKRVLNDENFRGWLHRNNDARRAFIERTDKGMNLSDRVWKSTRQLRDEMEIAMTIAIGEGDSAASMSRKVRQYLNDPDLMFRRFRYKDDEGNWQRKWKKRITDPDTGKHTWIDYDKDSYRDEWTGPGYYKSSAKNAMRVTRTETNMAYRAADNARWEQLDFILGIHIQPSESHPQPDICDELAGDYPKTFKFTGWHPQCFCVMTPILPTDDELVAMADAKLEGEEYTPETDPITDYPKGFKDFVQDNAENINKARLSGTEHYFLRDNKDIVDKILHSKTTEKWDWRSIIYEMPNEDAEEEVYQYLKHLPARERRALMKAHEDDFNSYLVKLIEEHQDEDYPDFLQVNYSLYRHLEANGNTIPDDLKRYFHEGYKGGFYKRYNAALRQGKDISPELTDALDKLTKSGSLPTDMMLHRYVDVGYLEANFGITNGMSADEAIEIIAKRKGSILVDKAYTSTSAIIENNAMEYQGVKIKILAPKGTKAFISDNFDESEILLPRGQRFEVVGVSKYHNAQGKDSVELVLKLQKEPVSTQHSTQSIAERAAERHAKRTAADVERIQTAWNTRLFNNFVAETDRIGSWRDKDMREWALILQDEIDLKEFGAFKIDYAKAKAALQGRISSETAAASSFMATKANAENIKALAKALGVEQGELMTFFEADMLRGNPNFAADVMYRVNCQTCVVANELRRRGFNIQALGNFAGSKSEVLSMCTNGIWQTADGKVPSKMRIGAEFNQWSYIDPTGKRHKKGFAKTVANRKQLVSELETNLTEDGRYHIDWTWQGGGKTRSGHIITVEKIGDTIRYYDPQNGKVISDFTEYIKGIDLSRGINLLRVDNLRIKPDYAAEILAKSGTSASSGTAATGGVSRLRQDVLKQVRRNNTEWVKNNLPTVELPDGTPALRDVVKNIQGNNIIVNQGTFGEIFAKNINRNNISDILDVAHDYKEWMPRAELLTDGSPEPGRHHGYSFNVYRVTYRGQEIEIKTKLTDAEYLYNIKFI